MSHLGHSKRFVRWVFAGTRRRIILSHSRADFRVSAFERGGGICLEKDADRIAVDELVLKMAVAQQLPQGLVDREISDGALSLKRRDVFREIDELKAAILGKRAQREIQRFGRNLGVFSDGGVDLCGRRNTNDTKTRNRSGNSNAHETSPASFEACYDRRQTVRRAHAAKERLENVKGPRLREMFFDDRVICVCAAKISEAGCNPSLGGDLYSVCRLMDAEFLERIETLQEGVRIGR